MPFKKPVKDIAAGVAIVVILVLLALAMVDEASGASTGWQSPTSCDEVTDCNVDTALWSGESSAEASDDVRAAVTLGAGDKSACLRCSFDFDILYGADTITLDAKIEAQATAVGIITDVVDVRTGDGDYHGNDNDGLPLAVLTDQAFEVLDLATGGSWASCAEASTTCETGTQYNVNHTGVAVLFAVTSTGAAIAHVDHVQARVNFRPPRAHVHVMPHRPVSVPTVPVPGIDPPPTLKALP